MVWFGILCTKIKVCLCQVDIKVEQEIVDLSNYVSSHSFILVNTTAVATEFKYSQDQDVGNGIATFILEFRRVSTYATHLFLAPSLTLSLVIPTIFFMPVGSTERTTLGLFAYE